MLSGGPSRFDNGNPEGVNTTEKQTAPMETGVNRDNPPEFAGFLLVQEIPGPGYCGGYLILNRLSRPVEFHCTLPVCPDNAQRILYGASLESFLMTNHIARPLIEKARKPVSIIFVEQAALAEVADLAPVPVVRVLKSFPDEPSASGSTPRGSNRTCIDIESWIRCPGSGGKKEVNTPAAPIVEFFQSHFGLLEPFDRIREALRQANPARAA